MKIYLEDNISETGRDALDSEVKVLCRELPVEEDCPRSRDDDDNDPEKPPLSPEVLLGPVAACQIHLLADIHGEIATQQ